MENLTNDNPNLDEGLLVEFRILAGWVTLLDDLYILSASRPLTVPLDVLYSKKNEKISLLDASTIEMHKSKSIREWNIIKDLVLYVNT